MAVLVGIAGGTGSGKTTVANSLAESLPGQSLLLQQDSFYKNHDDLTFEERSRLNYDHPEAFDTDTFITVLQTLKEGRPAVCPIYDFSTHSRLPRGRYLEPMPLVVLEGILILHDQRVRNLLDFKVYVDTDGDVRLSRRIRRDMTERGRSLDSVLQQYEQTVKPMHELFVEPTKRYADIILPEGGLNKVGVSTLMAQVQALVAAADGSYSAAAGRAGGY
ncbi:MAG: uridine kinase [Symbiobacteriia bacterium]